MADLAMVVKANRWSGFMESLAWTKRRIACLMDSILVMGRPLEPVVLISTEDSGFTSMQKRISSLFNLDGFSEYPLPPLSTSIASMVPSASVFGKWNTKIRRFVSCRVNYFRN